MHEDDLVQLWLEIVDERGLVLARVGRDLNFVYGMINFRLIGACVVSG